MRSGARPAFAGLGRERDVGDTLAMQSRFLGHDVAVLMTIGEEPARALDREGIRRHVDYIEHLVLDDSEIDASLDRLVASGLVVREGDQVCRSSKVPNTRGLEIHAERTRLSQLLEQISSAE